MIFELAKDFHDAVAAMPREHPKRWMLELLKESLEGFCVRYSASSKIRCSALTCWRTAPARPGAPSSMPV